MICGHCNKVSIESHPKWGGKRYWHRVCVVERQRPITAKNSNPRNDWKLRRLRQLDLGHLQPLNCHTYISRGKPKELDLQLEREWQVFSKNSLVLVGPTRAQIVAANKAAELLLIQLGVKTVRPIIHREKPVPGVPRAPRKRQQRDGSSSSYQFNKAVIEQDGSCYFCTKKFGTLLRHNDYDAIVKLLPEEEHLIPKNAGGTEIHAACQICNRVKSDYVFTGKDDSRLVDLISREHSHYTTVQGTMCNSCGQQIAA